jgi:hypothetical protein
VSESASAPPGTWRTVDGSAVSFNDARLGRAFAAHEVLVDTATRFNDFITYKELSEQVQKMSGIRTRSQMRNWIGSVLARVADRCHGACEPPLTALCVRQDHTGIRAARSQTLPALRTFPMRSDRYRWR